MLTRSALDDPISRNQPQAMATRRQRIEDMLREEPNDPFLQYSLALEYRNEGLNDESVRLLTHLVQTTTPKYVAAFFMAAQQLVELDRIEEARALLREGIEEARLQNNHHAAAEMGDLLSQIGSS